MSFISFFFDETNSGSGLIISLFRFSSLALHCFSGGVSIVDLDDALDDADGNATSALTEFVGEFSNFQFVVGGLRGYRLHEWMCGIGALLLG